MGKARFVCLLLYILIPAAAFLLSGVASKETDDVVKKNGDDSFQETDKNLSMTIKNTNNNVTVLGVSSNKTTTEVKETMLSEDQFLEGIALIDLPYGFQLFDLNVTRVAVTKEGTIQSADPSVNWTIAPINAKSGMSRSSIYYQIKDKTLHVQWIEFQFKHENFEEHQFRFKVKLGKDGDIKIRYQEVPYNLKAMRQFCDNCLEDKFGVMYSYQEELKVAPYNETYELGLYLDFDEYRVQSGSVLRLFTADWCMFRKNCEDCTKTGFHPTLNETAPCSWCPAIDKCFSTRDSLQNFWIEDKCDVNATNFCIYDVAGDSGFDYYYNFYHYVLPIAIVIIIIIVIFLLYKFGGAVFCCKKTREYSYVQQTAPIELTSFTSKPEPDDMHTRLMAKSSVYQDTTYEI